MFLSVQLIGLRCIVNTPSKPFPPHVMIYAPYLKKADIGVPAEHVRSHSNAWVLNEGRDDAYS